MCPTSIDAEDRLRIPKSSADFGILVGRGLGTTPLRILRNHCVVPPGGKPFSLPLGLCDSHTPHAYIYVSLTVSWDAHTWRYSVMNFDESAHAHSHHPSQDKEHFRCPRKIPLCFSSSQFPHTIRNLCVTSFTAGRLLFPVLKFHENGITQSVLFCACILSFRIVFLRFTRVIYLLCICCCCSVPKSMSISLQPVDCSTPGFPVLHCLPDLTQTHVHWW